MKIPNLKSSLEIERFIAQKSKEYYAIDFLIQGAEIRAKVRTFGNAAVFLTRYFLKIANHFENFTNEEKNGVEIAVYSHAERFSSGYYRKGMPECSRIVLKFKSGKWNVLSCERSYCPKENEFQILTLPEKAREKALNLFCNF